MDKRMMVTLLVALLVAYGVGMGVVYFGQERLLYQPEASGGRFGNPSDIGLAYEDVWLDTSDRERVHAWFVKTRAPRGTLLYCHGNAGNISHRLESLRIFAALGLDVLIFDYRGYGASSGKPSEAGTYLDAATAWAWLADRRPANRILIFGRSLGAAVALDLATQVKAGGLILESPFTSIPDLGAEFYPFLPVRLLARYAYDNLAKIPGLKTPLLLVHSTQDEMIPFRHGQALFSAAPEPKQMLEIRGGHNDGFIVSGPLYRDGLAAFLDARLGSGEAPKVTPDAAAKASHPKPDASARAPVNPGTGKNRSVEPQKGQKANQPKSPGQVDHR